MSSVVNSSYENDLTFVLDYLVEAGEYKPWRERLFKQILQNVEVPGFRKGKAPEELAIKNVNIVAVEDTILRETIQKYGTLAFAEAKKMLEADSRVVQNQNADLDEENTKETADGFQFRIKVNLLPKVDLDPISNIKIPVVDKKDLPKRLSKEEFTDIESKKFLQSFNNFVVSESVVEKNDRVIADVVEHSKGLEARNIEGVTYTLGAQQLPKEFEENLIGMKAGENKEFSLKLPVSAESKKSESVKYNVTIKEVLRPEFESIEKLLDSSEEAKSQFKTVEDFKDFLMKYYDQETNVILEDFKKRNVIRAVLKAVPDFSLPLDKVEAEQKRIFEAMQSQASQRNMELGDILIESGITDVKDKVLTDLIEIKKQVDSYVVREFKWLFILRNVYELKVDNKISEEELNQAIQEINKNPAQFNLSKDSSKETIQEVGYDRLMRNRAAKWLFDTILNAQEIVSKAGEVTNSEFQDVEVEKKPAKKKAKTE